PGRPESGNRFPRSYRPDLECPNGPADRSASDSSEACELSVFQSRWQPHPDSGRKRLRTAVGRTNRNGYRGCRSLRLWGGSKVISAIQSIGETGCNFSATSGVSDDKSARVWDVRKGRALTELMRQEHAVHLAKIGAGGQRVITVSETDAAWLWDVRLLQPLTVLRWLQSPPVAGRFSPDGRQVM